jgi:hypothetical protein
MSNTNAATAQILNVTDALGRRQGQDHHLRARRRTMTKSRTLLALTVALVGIQALAGATARAADTCQNAAIRLEQGSARLPDCRAYELVTPDLNHASLGTEPTGATSPDGGKIAYGTRDAPANAHSASVWNMVLARRGANGWSGAGLAPPFTAPTPAYMGSATRAFSLDLSTTYEASAQPLAPGAGSGMNVFVGNPDSGYDLLSPVPTQVFPGYLSYFVPEFRWATPDFGHVYFSSFEHQVPEDPVSFNTYVWSRDRGTRLLGILPDGTPAPNGATVGPIDDDQWLGWASDDGKYAAFYADGHLYLRVDDDHTVDVAASQRTVDAGTSPAGPVLVGVSHDGSKVLFTTPAELTNDAYTGRSGGVPNGAGSDLYSYDTATGVLADLTANSDTVNAGAGANVVVVAKVTDDASRIYFLADGVLADGARAGHRSLYVWHDGQIDFVAPGDGIVRSGMKFANTPYFDVTPDGKRFLFASTDSLTGYDNTDPVTGASHAELFTGELGGELKCVSCRPGGTRPTADSVMPQFSSSSLGPSRRVRVMSDDGKRIFFYSMDAVVPSASSGMQTVFEYSEGRVSLISPGNASSPATFLDASASGDDVFFATHDELVANPNGGDYAIYDAKVGGGFATPPAPAACKGEDCRTDATPAPSIPVAASLAFADAGGAEAPVATSALLVKVSDVKSVTGTTASLRVTLPEAGTVRISGAGLRAARAETGKANTVPVRVSLTSAATRSLRKRRQYKTRATVVFAPRESGRTSRASVSLTFKLAKKGR